MHIVAFVNRCPVSHESDRGYRKTNEIPTPFPLGAGWGSWMADCTLMATDRKSISLLIVGFGSRWTYNQMTSLMRSFLLGRRRAQLIEIALTCLLFFFFSSFVFHKIFVCSIGSLYFNDESGGGEREEEKKKKKAIPVAILRPANLATVELE